MSDLHKKAEELGIKVDGRWSDARLKKEISAKQGDEPKDEKMAEEKLFPVTLVRNYRPVGSFKIVDKDGERGPTEEEEQKVPAGTTIILALDEAKSVISKKIADRADAIG